AIYAGLTLLALHEVFRDVFIAFYDFRWFWLIFPGAVVVISLFAVWMAIWHPPMHAPHIVAMILSFGIGVSFIKAGVLGVFLLLVWILGLSHRHYPFGIAEGFAISAVGTWLSFGFRSGFGTKFDLLAKY